MWDLQNRPTGFQHSPSQQDYMKYWSPYTPQPGTPLDPSLHPFAGRETAFGQPMGNFNAGPQGSQMAMGENPLALGQAPMWESEMA